MWPWNRHRLSSAANLANHELGRLGVFRLLLGAAFTGCLALGSTGSGKTTGAFGWVLTQFIFSTLRMGGLFLCSKPEDRRMIEELARRAGRADDLVIFEPGGRHAFNLLQYELMGPGGMAALRIENVVRLFQIVLEIAERSRGSASGSGDHLYFQRAALQLLRMTLLCLILAEELVTLENIQRFVLTAPQSLAEAESAEWRASSFSYQTMCKADDRLSTPSETKDFEQALLYWMREYAAMDPKPRGSIVSTFSVMADMFNRGAIRDTFFSETTITPEACREGKIIVLDFSVLVWNEVGRVIQAAFKFVWQRAMERLPPTRPVFLAADEFQGFLTTHDATFQATARSSQVCTLYATQNLPGMYEAVGGEPGRHVIDNLLGNLRLKFFHAQDDAVTCEWQSKLGGQVRRFLVNANTQPQVGEFDWFRPAKNTSSGISENWEYRIQPWEWSRHLRTGGPRHGFKVDAYLYQGGVPFGDTDDPFLLVTFDQLRNA